MTLAEFCNKLLFLKSLTDDVYMQFGTIFQYIPEKKPFLWETFVSL